MGDAPAAPRRVAFGIVLSLFLLLFPGLPTPAAPHVPPEAAIVSHALGLDFHCREWVQKKSKQTGRWTVYLESFPSSAEVDKQSGLITEFFTHATLSKQTGPPLLSADEARARAALFLERAGVPPHGLWILTTNKYLDHGVGSREYEFDWCKMLHGVRLPASLGVNVNADDGSINSYLLFDAPPVTRLWLRYGRQDAMRAAAHKIGWASADCMYFELSAAASHGPYGRYGLQQSLQWRLCLRNTHLDPHRENYQEVVVDATTGKVFLNLYGCCPKRAFEEYQANAIALHFPPIDLKAAQREAVPPTVFELALRKPQ